MPCDWVSQCTEFTFQNSGFELCAAKVKSAGSCFLGEFSGPSAAMKSSSIHFAIEFRVALGDSGGESVR